MLLQLQVCSSSSREWVILSHSLHLIDWFIFKFYNMAANNWCVTINNPVEEPDLAPEKWANNLKLYVAGLETGSQGTLHYQTYLELQTPRTLQWLKARLPTAHFERRRGTRQQAIEYCLKNYDLTSFHSTSTTGCENSTTSSQSTHPSVKTFDSTSNSWILLNEQNDPLQQLLLGEIIYYGRDITWMHFVNSLTSSTTRPTSNQETRLQAIKEMIDSGLTDLEIANKDFPLFCKYYRSFTYYRLLSSSPRSEPPDVYVFQGPTGTGKSKTASELFPNAFWKTRGNWWDGYLDQETVIIDEFYGWLPWDLLLRLCDRYPLQVEVKGGTVNFNAKTIIFTTNALPCKWYKNCYFPAFERRVKEWWVFPRLGERQIYLDYNFTNMLTTPNFNFPN